MITGRYVELTCFYVIENMLVDALRPNHFSCCQVFRGTHFILTTRRASRTFFSMRVVSPKYKMIVSCFNLNYMDRGGFPET